MEKEKSGNINVDAAYLHVLGDLLMSVGVTIAATVIYFYPTKDYPWSKYVDPACTLFFSIVVCYTCKKTLGNCVYILMEGAPEAIDGNALKEELTNIGSDVQVHDFHIWSISRGKNVMSARIQCSGEPMKHLVAARKVCKEFGLDSCTIQIEDTTELEGEIIEQQW